MTSFTGILEVAAILEMVRGLAWEVCEQELLCDPKLVGRARDILSKLADLDVRIARLEPMTPQAELRPAVTRFARIMEERLRENDHKPGWLDSRTEWLFGRLVEEIGELAFVLTCDPPGSARGKASAQVDAKHMARECADIANFAMMLEDPTRGHRPVISGPQERWRIDWRTSPPSGP